MRENSALQPLDLDIDLSDLEHAVRPTVGERLSWRLGATAQWIRRHAADLLILAVLVTVAVVVHMRGMYTTPARFDDEGTYTAYAWAVQVEHRLSHYTYWYAHPPIGWMQMALWNWATDGFARAPYAVASVRQLMVLSKAISVVLLYVLALRLRMTRGAAIAAVLMFSLSPLAVYFTRTALLDNIVTPWLLASFLLAASRRRGLGAAAGSAACFAMAVLSKETALLFLPALVVLFWQCSDRRNRKFTLTFFGSTLFLMLLLYPAYALVKNELLPGSGHVSLLWAVQWQLFDRQGSGSIFTPNSTAHAVLTSWVIQDPWLTRLAVVLILPGLLVRRTRAITLAFGIQVGELLRSGYLPYPFVVAMIPFGALVIAGVADVVWQRMRPELPSTLTRHAAVRRLTADRTTERSALVPRPTLAERWRARGGQPGRPAHRRPSLLLTGTKLSVRVAMLAAVAVFLSSVQAPFTARIKDLWYGNRDAGAAAALSWVRANVATTQWLVVDDAFWVDLVRSGFRQKRTIWFTKLDVDPDVKLPVTPAWKGIDYVMLTYQDEMSVHLTLDDQASAATAAQFPTLAGALRHSTIVGRFGSGKDRVVVWRVLRDSPGTRTGGS